MGGGRAGVGKGLEEGLPLRPHVGWGDMQGGGRSKGGGGGPGVHLSRDTEYPRDYSTPGIQGGELVATPRPDVWGAPPRGLWAGVGVHWAPSASLAGGPCWSSQGWLDWLQPPGNGIWVVDDGGEGSAHLPLMCLCRAREWPRMLGHRWSPLGHPGAPGLWALESGGQGPRHRQQNQAARTWGLPPGSPSPTPRQASLGTGSGHPP